MYINTHTPLQHTFEQKKKKNVVIPYVNSDETKVTVNTLHPHKSQGKKTTCDSNKT